MRVNFIRTKDGNLIRTKDLDVIPRKGDLIKYHKMMFYIEETLYDLENNEYNIHMYEL